MIRKIWRLFRQEYPKPWKAVAMATVFAGALIVIGAVLVVGGAAGLAWTETEDFCISCHSMRDNNYAEYKGTIHDVNRVGVRATCSDCHVPKKPGPLIKAKVLAMYDLWGEITGSIDSSEKFKAERPRLAQSVWRKMKNNDSAECRNCHSPEHMDPSLISERAASRHEKMKTEGKTCIECHFGIAHDEPEGPGPAELFASKSPAGK